MPAENLKLRLWHALIAASALTGVALAAAQYDVWWTALSQLASLAAGLCYLTLAVSPRVEARAWAWTGGALATLMVLVSLGFLAMQHGNLFDAYSIFEHLLTPALVVLDYLILGSAAAHVQWWHPLTWLMPPAAYLACYVGFDLGVYQALDPARFAPFVANVLVLTALVLAAGFALPAAARRLRWNGRPPRLGSERAPGSWVVLARWTRQ